MKTNKKYAMIYFSHGGGVTINLAETYEMCIRDRAGIKATIQTYEESLMNPIIAEKTGWDFVVTRLGGSTLVASWNTLFNNDVHDGMTTNWLDDPKLQELYQTSLADETHDRCV